MFTNERIKQLILVQHNTTAGASAHISPSSSEERSGRNKTSCRGSTIRTSRQSETTISKRVEGWTDSSELLKNSPVIKTYLPRYLSINKVRPGNPAAINQLGSGFRERTEDLLKKRKIFAYRHKPLVQGLPVVSGQGTVQGSRPVLPPADTRRSKLRQQLDSQGLPKSVNKVQGGEEHFAGYTAQVLFIQKMNSQLNRDKRMLTSQSLSKKMNYTRADMLQDQEITPTQSPRRYTRTHATKLHEAEAKGTGIKHYTPLKISRRA